MIFFSVTSMFELAKGRTHAVRTFTLKGSFHYHYCHPSNNLSYSYLYLNQFQKLHKVFCLPSLCFQNYLIMHRSCCRSNSANDLEESGTFTITVDPQMLLTCVIVILDRYQLYKRTITVKLSDMDSIQLRVTRECSIQISRSCYYLVRIITAIAIQ